MKAGLESLNISENFKKIIAHEKSLKMELSKSLEESQDLYQKVLSAAWRQDDINFAVWGLL